MRSDSVAIASPFEFVEEYYSSFREKVFTLLYIGYAYVISQKADLSNADEDVITDEITEGIDQFRFNRNSPDWVDHIQVCQQPPYASGGETGDNRKWLDLFFQGNRTEQCYNFCFEAKRLYANQRHDRYFGNDGMQRFLKRAEYPLNCAGEAAMLGYVQSHNVSYWIDWLLKYFNDNSHQKELLVRPGFSWEKHFVINEMEYIFRTGHILPSGQPVFILHTLLIFT